MSIKFVRCLVLFSLVLFPINSTSNTKLSSSLITTEPKEILEEDMDYDSWIIHKQIICINGNTYYCD
jgi:ATP/ADP translocase